MVCSVSTSNEQKYRINGHGSKYRINGNESTSADGKVHSSTSEDLVGDGWVLTNRQMRHLRSTPYMYNCFVGSLLELLVLQKFWYQLSLHVPKKLAPCVLTCTGLAINILCTSLVLWYSPDAKQMVPSWTFVVCAVGLFVYQIFDALDGKQAIRVQDTQIEEVYDHGCDAISAILVTQSVAVATLLGQHSTMQLLFFITSLFAFFMTHFSCHTTHVMVFGKIDVIEGQWAMIVVHLLTAYFGQNFWSSIILYKNISLLHLLWLASILSLLRSVISNLAISFGASTPLDVHVKIPRNQSPRRWNSFIAAILITTMCLFCYSHGLFEQNSMIFLLTFGLSMAKLTFHLQIMTVSSGELPFFESSLLSLFLLSLNAHFNFYSNNIVLVVAFLLALADHIRFFVMSSLDMKKALEVDIFTLRWPVGHLKCRNKNFGFNMNGTENETALKNMRKASKLLCYCYNQNN